MRKERAYVSKIKWSTNLTRINKVKLPFFFFFWFASYLHMPSTTDLHMPSTTATPPFR